jgi:CHAD domain-containing protein
MWLWICGLTDAIHTLWTASTVDYGEFVENAKELKFVIHLMKTVESLCAKYDIDMAHARHVATLASKLFDATREIHQLDARSRKLAETGAILHNVALNIDEKNHHTVGRDIVMATPLKGFNQIERAMLACVVGFHRKEVQPNNEPIFDALSETQRRQTLILSALVRVADGLDDSQTQTTILRNVVTESDRVVVRTEGAHSHSDSARAEKKADLWAALFAPMSLRGKVTRPSLTPDLSLAEAGRRVMRYHFDKIEIEDWRPQGELSPKEIKKTRVVTRRLRNDARLFEAVYRKKSFRPIAKGLKTLSELFSDAREMNVMLETLRAYQTSDEAIAGTRALSNEWESRQKKTHTELEKHLRSDEHDAWVTNFIAFLSTQNIDDFSREADVGEPSLVRHVSQSWLWQHRAAVQAFDTMSESPNPEHLHQLRLEIKRLRYFVDTFRDVIPIQTNEANDLIGKCIEAQDALGVINDAHVSSQHALAFIEKQRPSQRVGLKGIAAFAEAEQRVIESRLKDWREFLSQLI